MSPWAIGTPTALYSRIMKPVDATTLNQITSKIIAAAIAVHRAFGPGLLEAAYIACLAYELQSMGLHVELEKRLPLVYGSVHMDCAFRADLVVDDLVVVEVKALDVLAPVHSRQVLTYLKVGDYRVGLLLNFGARTMKDGVERIVYRFPS
jgi:GxxExxY protein